MARKARRQRVTFEGPCVVSGERYPDGGSILIREGRPHRGQPVLLSDGEAELHVWTYSGRRRGVPYVQRRTATAVLDSEPLPAGYRILGEVLLRSFVP